jgi:hypothetical protein
MPLYAKKDNKKAVCITADRLTFNMDKLKKKKVYFPALRKI